MLFLLHLPAEARSLHGSPLSQETCEFLLACMFHCCSAAVMNAILKPKREVSEYEKIFKS